MGRGKYFIIIKVLKESDFVKISHLVSVIRISIEKADTDTEEKAKTIRIHVGPEKELRGSVNILI